MNSQWQRPAGEKNKRKPSNQGIHLTLFWASGHALAAMISARVGLQRGQGAWLGFWNQEAAAFVAEKSETSFKNASQKILFKFLDLDLL